MGEEIYKSQSSEETQKHAQNLAGKLKAGSVIALIGNLGGGKTTFIQGICQYFNVTDYVASPTFTLINEYKVNPEKNKIKKIIHIDCYRLDTEKQFYELGIEDYFNSKNSIILIEWADRVKSILPRNTIFIYFKHLGQDKREIKIKK